MLTLGDAVNFQEKLGLAKANARRQALWTHFQNSVEAHPKLTWRSPNGWDLGSSLYAIEIHGKNSRELSDEMYRAHGFVFRPFHGENWNTVRMSLNTFNTYEEIDRFLALIG